MPALPQQTIPAPPKPAEALPSPGAPNVVTTGAVARSAMTLQDVKILRARRSELSRQLESAASRRRGLSEQIRRAQGADKAGLEGRMAVIDARMARLESEIDQVGQQLASPEAARINGIAGNADNFSAKFDFNRVNPEPIILAFTLFVFAPFALAVSRLVWKRGSAMPRRELPNDSAQRLERMEQTVEAIAVEIERVSEGQRFVTRLLSERNAASLGMGQQPAEPVRVPLSEARPVR